MALLPLIKLGSTITMAMLDVEARMWNLDSKSDDSSLKYQNQVKKANKKTHNLPIMTRLRNGSRYKDGVP